MCQQNMTVAAAAAADAAAGDVPPAGVPLLPAEYHHVLLLPVALFNTSCESP
jgi:hypothetical protein